MNYGLWSAPLRFVVLCLFVRTTPAATQRYGRSIDAVGDGQRGSIGVKIEVVQRFTRFQSPRKNGATRNNYAKRGNAHTKLVWIQQALTPSTQVR